MQITIPSIYSPQYGAKVVSLDDPYERKRFQLALDMYDQASIVQLGSLIPQTDALVGLDRNNTIERSHLPTLIDVCENFAIWTVRLISGCSYVAVANAMMIIDPRWRVIAVGVARNPGDLFLGGKLTLHELDALYYGKFPPSLRRLGVTAPGFKSRQLLDSSMNILDPSWYNRIIRRNGCIPDEKQRWRVRELSQDDKFQRKLQPGEDPYDGNIYQDYKPTAEDKLAQTADWVCNRSGEEERDNHGQRHNTGRLSSPLAQEPYDVGISGPSMMGRRPPNSDNDLLSDETLPSIRRACLDTRRGRPAARGYQISLDSIDFADDDLPPRLHD